MLSDKRRGITLVEVLIGLVIVAAMAAVLYPAIGAQVRRGQSAALANQIANLRDAISAYRQNVGRYPNRLTELSTALVNGDQDSCGSNVPAVNRNQWRGPYLTQAVSGNMVVGDYTALNVLVRSPTTDAGNPPGTLIIHFTGVDSLAAAAVEKVFDATVNYSSGAILWVHAGDDTLKFQMLIRNC